MTRFAYEDLYPHQFEELVVLICQELLGIAVQGFADGADGGRDARFEGTAQLMPSTSSPWEGRVVIQAKHTNGLNRSFNETDFFSQQSNTSVLALELPKVKKLKDKGDLDHYMLFANRRLTAGVESEIRSAISSACGIPSTSIYICGLEQLELWLRRFKEIVETAGLDPVDSPLIISPDELAEIVVSFASQRDLITATIDDAPVERTSLVKKNRLNGMTAEYAAELRRLVLVDERQIRSFLAAPENVELLELYEATVDEIQLKIIAKRKDYQSFDDVLNYLLDLLYSRDAVLRQRSHKRLTRSLLFYMYWNCDIGQVAENVEAI
ncbi:hypothetical protein DEJ27_08510 [Curtobacterium sp. MCPF17_018]|uniref:ABC-three component system protein n=1 Tax=Curtobacterium sp. MCPF17_018 TaxID=2175638 RepID=UPI000DA950B4|nr:ABC-three component system protein [Curtobacterium sp. MCPF17_018]PZE69316.1 hypothetical protein DEJ27_08510 [Curtobacterium sp. MCPF17_018]